MAKYIFRFQDDESNMPNVTIQFDCEHDVTMGELTYMFKGFASSLAYSDATIGKWVRDYEDDDF